MNIKLVCIFVSMLMITTTGIPFVAGLTILKNREMKPQYSDGITSLEFMMAGNAPRALRSYWLHVPSSYDGSEAAPLVIVLHGARSFSWMYPFSVFRSSFTESYTEFSEKADDEGFIVVYPNAKLWLYFIKPTGYYYNPEYYPWEGEKVVDDIGFTRDLINEMKQNYIIDSSRIYITGFSNGGMMSYSIGSYLSDIVAAIAPVAGYFGFRGSLDEPFYYIPPPTTPVSVIVFHGTEDSSVPYTGSDFMASVNESISFWVEQNGCNPMPEIYTSPSGKIIRRIYTNGEKGTEVVLYTTIGGDHWWPGNNYSNPNAPWLVDTIHEISATDLIWEFFEAHPKQ